MSNVYSLVASATGYQNLNVSGADIPLTNASGTIPGPLNAAIYLPFTAPNTSAVGAGGDSVFIASGLNTSLTAANAPAPVNLTALGMTVPASGPINGTSTAPGASGSSGTSSAARRDVFVGGAAVFGIMSALVGSAVLFV